MSELTFAGIYLFGVLEGLCIGWWVWRWPALRRARNIGGKS